MIRSSKKKVSDKSKIAALDAACRQRVVIERDGNTCQWCGKRDGEWDAEIGQFVEIQWSHVKGRRDHALRWEDDNSKALCKRCHCRWTNHPLLGIDWFIKKFPERWERITNIMRVRPRVRFKDLYEELRSGGVTPQ